jgi:hypothetical protein
MIVTVKDTLLKGMRAVFYNWKFVILFWGVNALFSIVLTLPIFQMLMDNLGNSLLSGKLNQAFDYIWYLQFRNLYETNLEHMPLTIFGAAGIYTLIQTFFLGGLIAIFNFPKKNHIIDFFYGGVKYWFRFTKILLISLVFFVAAFKLNDLLGDLIAWIFQNSENEIYDFILRSLRYILLVFLIGIITLISDYTKVGMAIEGNYRALQGIVDALFLIKRNFTLIFTVFLLIAIFGAFGVLVYNIVGLAIPRTPYYFLIISFILQQMLIIFRFLIRMYFAATEVGLYKDLSAEVVDSEKEITEQFAGE